MTIRDSHAQPFPAFNERFRIERDLSEMLGLAKGVIMDGVVVEEEAAGLLAWAEEHYDVTSVWPGNVLLKRLRTIYADGRVTEDEREDLLELLTALTGGHAGMIAGMTASSQLPLNRPQPQIEIPDRVFVFTGRFAFGPRPACEHATRQLGGWVEGNLTLRTDYLVVGTFASRDWIQTPYGRKIEKAVKYRNAHGHPAIVSEDQWANSL